MPKKISLLTFSFLVICFSSNAQLSKGDRMVGATVGSIFLNTGNGDQKVGSIGSLTYNTRSIGLSFNPSMGWFITDKTVVGGTININPTSQRTTYMSNGSTFQKDESKNFNIGIGAFARNYFNSNGTFIPFAQFGVNGGMSNVRTEGFFYGGSGATAYKETYEGKSSGGVFVNTALSFGMTKMVGQLTGLDFYAGYNFSHNKNNFKNTKLRDEGNNGSIDQRSESETETNFTNHGFVLGVGFQVFLRKKK